MAVKPEKRCCQLVRCPSSEFQVPSVNPTCAVLLPFKMSFFPAMGPRVGQAGCMQGRAHQGQNLDPAIPLASSLMLQPAIQNHPDP